MSNYRPRKKSDLSPLAKTLVTEGIANVAPIFTAEELQGLSAAMDPIFAMQSLNARSYVTIEDMARLGVLDTVLGGAMRNLLLSIVSDPVLYHCHAYEIAENSKRSHIFSESLAGWHRDVDSEYLKGDVTHASIFVYMTDVGPQDGAFEFSPVEPSKWVRSTNPSITVTGQPGYSFAWNRNFYHRASPNRGPVRRRLIKLSIQPNAFESAHHFNPQFSAAREMVPAGDPYLDLLLGRYRGLSAPIFPAPVAVEPILIQPTGAINIPDSALTKLQLRDKARSARIWLKRRITRTTVPQVASYD